MLTIQVWLLAISSMVNIGEVVAVQPQMYPTAQDCEQVRKNLPSARGNAAYYTTPRCIQTNVLVPK